ncbi:MAG TPA: HlyD family efflux transporter periplasmic adaptor subunit [Thermoanaerobaculia bacterium]|nr:HlyD family efflux transporter periplasmic adaptor subunit [Thermoanaerobaculia bacterium]
MKTAAALVVALLSTACTSSYSEEPAPETLRVRRGTFANDVLLSGELEAARGDFLAVPQLPSWQTAIKWLAEDGTVVKGGQPVIEFDNASLTSELETKRQAAMQHRQQLTQSEAEWQADLEQKQLEADKKRSDLDKAKIDAAVPADILSARSYEEKQTALRRATTEHEKAVDVLASRRTAVEAERRNQMLLLEKAQRDIAIAEQAITALVLRAPRDGTVVVREHPWEGRKFQTGDVVFIGMQIAMLPDLSSTRVKAALPDVDDGKVAVGMPVTVTLDGFPDLNFTGRISAISAIAQESRRQSLRRHFDVLIALDKLDPERMRPGLSARVAVHREANKAALLVPRAGLELAGKAPRARLHDGSMRDVKLGPCNALDCVVVSGLAEGDTLLPVVLLNGEKRDA